MAFRNAVSLTSTSLSILRRFRSTLQKLPPVVGKPPDSFYHRYGEKPLVATTISRLIDIAPERFKDELAVVDCQQNIRKTYTDLKEESSRLASGFLALNLKKGERLAIWGPNRYEWLLTQLAAAKAGLILVPLNSAYQPGELDYCLQKVGIKTIVFPEQHLTQNYYKMICSLVPEVADYKTGFINSKRYPNLQSLILMGDKALPGTFTLNDVMNASGSSETKALEIIQNNAGIDDDLIIMFTSGTTAKPKAVLMTNFAVVNAGDQFATTFGYYEKKHRICCQVPLFHIFGALGCCYSSIVSGVTGIFPSFSYNPTKTLQAIHQEKCTTIYGTPTMFIDVIRNPDFPKTDTSTVHALVGGGARFTPELYRQLFTLFPNSKLYIAYGTTESCGLGATSEIARNINDLSKLDHTGNISANVEFKVVDPNNKLVPFGTDGELCFRGYFLMKRYWEDEEKTKETIIDGWYHSGDLGSITPDGYVTISGRIKDIIIRGGENINAKEIENVLVTHPNIVDAQVIGVHDDRLGEDVCAWIKLTEDAKVTESDVRKFCKEKIAHYKIPRYVRFVSNYPTTASGKVQKYLMVKEMNQILKAA
ncbi:hypothetical protein CHUAL_012369 [Chamberlinius hualienensis]